jgi:hypothetical protein
MLSRPVLSLASDRRVISPTLPIAEIRVVRDWAAMTVPPRPSRWGGLASARLQGRGESRRRCRGCDRRTEPPQPRSPPTYEPIQHHPSRRPFHALALACLIKPDPGSPGAPNWLWIEGRGLRLTSALSTEDGGWRSDQVAAGHPPYVGPAARFGSPRARRPARRQRATRRDKDLIVSRDARP